MTEILNTTVSLAYKGKNKAEVRLRVSNDDLSMHSMFQGYFFCFTSR